MELPNSFQYDSDIKSFLDQLGNPPFKVGGAQKQEVRMCCVLPGHSEKNPSLALNRIKGVFSCFGCGHAGGFAKFAKLTGLSYNGQKVTYVSDVDPFASMLNGVVALESDYLPKFVTAPNMLRDIPPGYNWRGLSGKFLNRLGAKFWYDPRFQVERVWMPAFQKKELVGWFARVLGDEEYEPLRKTITKASTEIHALRHRMKTYKEQHGKDDNYREAKGLMFKLLKQRAEAELALDTLPKYLNNPKMDALRILFPWDFIRREFHHPKKVVLVEGQVDALSLINHGIPALAILGTNNWSTYKESMVVSAGFDCIMLMMDGDKSGRKAQKALYEALKPKVPCLKRFSCPEGKDPATLPARSYPKIKAILEEA